MSQHQQDYVDRMTKSYNNFAQAIENLNNGVDRFEKGLTIYKEKFK